MNNFFLTMGNKSILPLFRSVVIIGDSTLAAYNCRVDSIADKLFTPSEISIGCSAHNLAVPGNSINQQLSVWNSYADKQEHDLILVQVGLNDLNDTYSNIQSNYLNLITTINSTKAPEATIMASCLLPCKSRLEDLGWVNGYQNWLDLNSFIMDGSFDSEIRNNYHVAIMNDGNGNLKSIYDCGDGIHENQLGADVMISGYRHKIFH